MRRTWIEHSYRCEWCSSSSWRNVFILENAFFSNSFSLLQKWDTNPFYYYHKYYMGSHKVLTSPVWGNVSSPACIWLELFIFNCTSMSCTAKRNFHSVSDASLATALEKALIDPCEFSLLSKINRCCSNHSTFIISLIKSLCYIVLQIQILSCKMTDSFELQLRIKYNLDRADGRH